jgi:hypothetical protein
LQRIERARLAADLIITLPIADWHAACDCLGALKWQAHSTIASSLHEARRICRYLEEGTEMSTDMCAQSLSSMGDGLRLRGGGGDGGSTGAESRSSYLEMYKERKDDKV